MLEKHVIEFQSQSWSLIMVTVGTGTGMIFCWSQWHKHMQGCSLKPCKTALYIYIYVLYVGLSPLPVRVTTRIITFLVGNPYKPSFPLLLGGGTTQIICMFTQFTPSLGHVTCVHTSHVAFPIFHGLKQITCRMSWRHFCKARKSLGQSLTKSLGNL